MCQCYGLYDNNIIIGFIGVLHYSNPKNPRIKKVSRLVILPDYQGIGLGTKFLNFVADIYKQQHFDFGITTSAKNVIYSLKKQDKWCMTRYSINKIKPNGNTYCGLNRSQRGNCYTASFMYK